MGYPYKLGEGSSGTTVTTNDLWEGFKQGTTVHGVPHVSGATGNIKKGIWFLISLTAVGWLSYHMYFICSLYFSYSTNIKIRILHEYAMDFPAVTLCNLNSIKKTKIGLQPVIESLLSDGVIKKKRRKKRYTDSSPICLPDDRFQQSTGLCYRLFNDQKVKLSGASGAIDICENIGACAYMPTTQEKVDFMKSTDLFAVKGVNSYWNWMQNNKWGNKYEITGYTNWNPAYIDSSKDSSHSVVSDDQKWHSYDRDKADETAYTLCQDMVECPHTPYDPDGDGIGFCWFMPFGDQELNEWQESNELCPIYEPDAHLIEPDSLAKLNYLVQSSGIFNGVTNNEYWINYEKVKWKSDDRAAIWTNFATNPTLYYNSDEPALAYIDANHMWRYGFKNDRTKTAAMVICEIELPVVKIFGTTTPATTVRDTTIVETTILDTTLGETTLPDTTMPKTTVPETTIPDTTVPETTIPQTTIPDTTLAETTIPDTTMQKTTVPETTIPDTTVPETTIPQTTLPQTTMQQTTLTKTTIPDTTILGTTIPDTTLIETTIPDTTLIETTIPDTTLIETTIPDTTLIETTVPDTTLLETTIPDTTLLETTIPDTTLLETTIPDTTILETTIPDTIKPVTTMQDTTLPESTVQEATILESTIPETTTPYTTIHETTVPSTTAQETTTLKTTSTTMNVVTAPLLTTTTSSEVRLLELKEKYMLHEAVLENLAVIPENTKSLMGYDRDELLLDCTYEGAECSRNDFSKFYNPDLGNCYIFNSGWYEHIKLHRARKTGRLYGLSVVMNIGEDDYIKKLGGASGAKVVIHNQNEMPHPEEDGLLLETGKVVSIGLRKVLIKRLSTPYGNCTDVYQDKEIDVFSEKYPVTYSAKDCKKTCYQRKLMKKCLCADSRFPSTGTAFQGISTHPCDTNNVTEANCKYMINNAFISGELGCNEECSDVCSESYYTYDVSVAKWPSTMHKDKIIEDYQPMLSNVNLSHDGVLERNLLTVEVFFEDFNFEEIREIPAYNIGQFASDIGGLLGLWIGMSVITVFEFIEFVVDLWVFSCSKLYLKCSKRKKNTYMSSLTKIVPSSLSSQVISVQDIEYSKDSSADKSLSKVQGDVTVPCQRRGIRRKDTDRENKTLSYISQRRIDYRRKISGMNMSRLSVTPDEKV